MPYTHQYIRCLTQARYRVLKNIHKNISKRAEFIKYISGKIIKYKTEKSGTEVYRKKVFYGGNVEEFESRGFECIF